MGHQHVFRWRYDRPPSLEQFQTAFPDDWSCAAYLAERRWPDGFVCPCCGSRKGWKLRCKPWVWECGGDRADADGVLSPCRRQTSVIAGTFMQGTHLALRTWFLAAHLVTTHSNGISALQLQAKLGIGSYKTAWLLLHKLRRAMVDPDREPLGGPDETVQVDESEVPFRQKSDPLGDGRGRMKSGKIIFAGAVECRPNGLMGRIRLERIEGYGRADLHPFVLRNTAAGSVIVTDGNSAYRTLPGRLHEENVLSDYVPAHITLRHVHRVFSNLKRWAMGVYHGLRKRHADIYLQEFVFRFNRRRQFRAAFERLLGIGVAVGVHSYRDIVGREPTFQRLKASVRGKDGAFREAAVREARVADVPLRLAERLLDPGYPPEPRRYRRRKPERPVLARRRTAFVFDTH